MGGANSSNNELKSISQNISQYQLYVGQMTNALPFPNLQIPPDCVFPEGIMLDDVNEFEQLYIEHCEVNDFNFGLTKITSKNYTNLLMFAKT